MSLDDRLIPFTWFPKGSQTRACLLSRYSAIIVLPVLLLLSSLAVAAQSKSVDDRLEGAAALIRDSRLQEAEEQLLLILKVEPNEARALNLLGTIRAQQSRLNEAETLFSQALRNDRQLVAARMNLAYLYLLKGVPEKTILELKEVVRLDPNNAEASYRLASLLLSQNHIDECISFVQQLSQSQSAPLLVVLGDAYLKKGKPDKAEESYRRALSNQDGYTDAVLGLAQTAQARGDTKQASLYLSRAKQLVVNSPETLYRFALVAMRSGDYEEANAALTQAVKLKPTEPAYFLALGTTWLQKPDLFEAEKAFRRSLELRPDSPQTQMSLGYTLLMQKKYSEARDWLEKSVQKDASVPETFYYLGLIAQEQNEDGRAIELFEKAIQLVPSFAHPHIALGSIYLKLKNYPRAQQELETGVKLDPNDSKAHYNLAVLYARLKNSQRAQEEMLIVEKLKSKSSGSAKEQDVPRPSEPRPPE